jgi:hypothetical protein
MVPFIGFEGIWVHSGRFWSNGNVQYQLTGREYEGGKGIVNWHGQLTRQTKESR